MLNASKPPAFVLAVPQACISKTHEKNATLPNGNVMGLKSVEASRMLRLRSLRVATDMSLFEQCGKYWCLLLTEVIKRGILF